jgi:hypothetical protein
MEDNKLTEACDAAASLSHERVEVHGRRCARHRGQLTLIARGKDRAPAAVHACLAIFGADRVAQRDAAHEKVVEPASLSSHRRPRPAPSFASTAVASAALLAEVVRRVQAATVAVGALAVMPAAVAVLRSRV